MLAGIVNLLLVSRTQLSAAAAADDFLLLIGIQVMCLSLRSCERVSG
jgi:hypothetical protein